jgi:hypothetical protein
LEIPDAMQQSFVERMRTFIDLSTETDDWQHLFSAAGVSKFDHQDAVTTEIVLETLAKFMGDSSFAPSAVEDSALLSTGVPSTSLPIVDESPRPTEISPLLPSQFQSNHIP